MKKPHYGRYLSKIKVTRKQLEKLYWEDGYSIRDIAHQLKVTPGTIIYHFKKLVLKMRTQHQACLMDRCRKKNSDSILQEKHHLWKGRIIHFSGYVLLRKPHKYVLEHRAIIEKKIGRKLRRKEVVHHMNGNKSDNRQENLMLFSSESEHQKWHHRVGLIET